MSIPWLQHIPTSQDVFGWRASVAPWWRYLICLVIIQARSGLPLVLQSVPVSGSILVIMVAVGAVCRDLTPKLADFRRSRPITAAQWFWTKYLSGLTTVLLITMIPLALIVMMGDVYLPSLNARGTIMYFGPVFLMIYSVSFLLACLLRHTVYAGILSVGVMLAFYLAPYQWESLSFLRIHNRVSPLLDTAYVPFVAVMTMAAAVATLLARQAIESDWHWRRSA